MTSKPYWPLKKVLVEKYKIKDEEATALADFLIPMLTWNHETRASAEDMLKHPWLDMEPNYDFKYTELEFDKMQLKKGYKKGTNTQQDEEVLEGQDKRLWMLCVCVG